MKRGSIAEAIRKQVRRQLRRVEALLQAGKMDDPEAVHDLRVALRRLRSLWRIAADGGDKQAKKLRRQARDLAQSMGAVRDLDVLVQRISTDQKEGHLPKAGASNWVRRLNKQRQAALDTALRQIQGDVAEKWLRASQKWAKDEGEGPGVNAALKAMVRGHSADVVELTKPAGDAELHELRIAVKRLRYLIEFFEKKIAEPRLKIEQLVKVQDVLGESRDKRAAAELARAEGLAGYANWLIEHAEDGVQDAIQIALVTAQQLDAAGEAVLASKAKTRNREPSQLPLQLSISDPLPQKAST